MPIVARFRSGAREHPEANALVIDAEQLREAMNRTARIGAQSRGAIEQVLRRVKGGLSNERFRINHEPGRALDFFACTV